MQSRVELLIIDNGSSDDTPKFLRELSRKNDFLRIYVEKEQGISHARNAALRESRAKYVLFLDDDDIAEDGWLASYLHFFENLPSDHLAGAGGAVIPKFETQVPRWFAPNQNTLNWSEKPQIFKRVGGPWNGNLALDRKVALSLGGYDEHLGRNGESMSSHEESALCARIQAAGYSFWWLPQARIRQRVRKERMTFAFACRSAFEAGKSAAIYKVSLRREGCRRWGWSLCRLIASPPQVLTGALAALLLLILHPVSRAATVWLQACRNAGFGYGLLGWLVGKK